MDVDGIRKHCLSFPHTMEMVQWEADLVFKVDGKMFAVAPLEVAPVRLSFKCTPENFFELCERPGIIPAPYMARAQWVALETLNAVSESELRDLLMQSYQLVWQRLPKKRREALSATKTSKTKTAGGASKAKTSAKKAKKPIRGRRK
ncbi:MAG TPA: MmcQ/YjbR family DNA-binding protein [Terriglobales bacterium]